MIFSSDQSGLSKALERRIRLELPAIEILQADSMDRLSQQLCRPLNQIAVIVMAGVDGEDILKLTAHKTILSHIHIIFVMKEDKRSSLLPLSLQLKTSFIGSPERLEDVLSVLKKIIIRIHLRNTHLT